MAMMKRGLGRGLDALLDPYIEETPEKSAGVLEVDVRKIDNNAQQPRKSFDEKSLSELAASIKTHGIVQPLIVRKNGERYLIVAGERRFRAARLAGLNAVPVIVTSFDDAAMHEVSLIENIQREDLNPIEEAAAIAFLMKQHDMTQEEVSERLGKSRPAIANALRLLHLPQPVIECVKDGSLSAGHGRAIAGVNDEKLQLRLCDECLRMGYSVRALESRVKSLNQPKAAPKKASPAPRPPAIADAEEKLRERLCTKVRIDGDEKRGRIVIDYFSKEELQTIYDLLFFQQKEK